MEAIEELRILQIDITWKGNVLIIASILAIISLEPVAKVITKLYRLIVYLGRQKTCMRPTGAIYVAEYIVAVYY